MRKGRRLIRLLDQAFTHVALTILTGGLAFPFFWMISTSVKAPGEIFTETPNWIPTRITFEHYQTIWTETPFPRYFANSMVVAFATTSIALFISVFGAYAVARFRFRGGPFFSLILLVTQMFPPVLLIIPLFRVMAGLSLIDTYSALIITYGTFAVPFSAWLLRGYFEALPAELEEAAMIDGCTRVGALRRVVLPLAAPGIAAVAIFAFILAWQEFMFALTLTRSTAMRTLPVGINMMVGFREVLWGPLMAGSVIITFPVVVFFLYLQKYIVSGLTLGAIKG